MVTLFLFVLLLFNVLFLLIRFAALPSFGQWYFRINALQMIAVTWMAGFLHLVGDENL
jgi:hypothetical protein